MGKNLAKNGNFERGDRGFDSDYTRVDGPPMSHPAAHPAYDIDNDARHAAVSDGDWGSFGDHTTGSGLMMVCDGGAGDVWTEEVHLRAGRTYEFSLWARLPFDGSNGLGTLPVLQFYADGAPIGASLVVQGPYTAGWQELSFTYTAAAGTSEISIRDATTDQAWNDFALDDIDIRKVKHPHTLEFQGEAPAHNLQGFATSVFGHHADTASLGAEWHPFGGAEPAPHVIMA